MFNSLRAIVFILATGAAAMALAGDAYYDIPVSELKLTEGKLPLREETNRGRLYRERERLRAMQPYAVLDGPGEVYVVSRGDSRDPWWMPAYIYICLPEGKDASGRLYVPNEELSGMLELKFTIPAADAEAEAKTAFQRAKEIHYDSLRDRNIPGGAWFRHQARLARAQRGLSKDKREGPRTAQSWRRENEISRTYELFTGGRAMSENLQLDRALPEAQQDETPVKLDTLEGITIGEIDWAPLIGDKQPKLDPLAAKIPADQHAVFFPSFRAALAVADEADRHDTPMLRLAQPRSENVHIIERYQRQLGLPLSDIARLLGPHVVKSMAITGSDPYYPTGTDVAVLFETAKPKVLESLLLGRITMAVTGVKDVKPITGEIDGLKYKGFVTPDRNISSYIARLDGAVVATNSLSQLKRLAAIAKGKAESIASLPEYKFFRIRYPLGAEDETALLFISDPTIRRWCGPRWRIAASRRTRARALLADLQAGQLDSLVKRTVRPGPIHTEFPTLGGELTLAESGVASSVYGTLDFTTPIAEIPLEEVTKAEAEAYRRWRDGYQRNWTWTFDPIAFKIGIDKNTLSADLSIMPLIIGTRYNELMSISLNGEFKPTDGDRHNALAQLMMAIDHDSRMFQQGNSFAAIMGQTVSLGWLGRWVNVYADDDPFWADLAEVEPDDMDDFMHKNIGRLPVAVRFDVTNPLKLAAFLTGARAFIEQTAPGLTQWDSLKYREQPYVRITPKKEKLHGIRELENLNIFYTTVDGVLTITLSENVLRGTIDRSLDREKAAESKTEKAAPHQWLGSNVALRVDSKILEIINAVNRKQYEEEMRTRCWNNLPILNEWKRLYPDRDPVEVHRRIWGVELLCPGGGKYVWNDKYRTMESTVYGHPGEQKSGPAAPPVLSTFSGGNFGLTFKHQGLRARAVLERAKPPIIRNED